MADAEDVDAPTLSVSIYNTHHQQPNFQRSRASSTLAIASTHSASCFPV